MLERQSFSIREAAKVIWDYHQLDHKLEEADCILVLGSNDVRVAEHAAHVFLQGWAPAIIFSGGIAHQNDLLAAPWNCSEAEHFAQIAERMGVPMEKIKIEDKATNTGENIRFSKQLLDSMEVFPKSFIVVQKPFMQRRVYATFRVYYPDTPLAITSPNCIYEDYIGEHCDEDTLIHLMVGDLQRIKLYAEQGYQIPQHVPLMVWDAFDFLIKNGFTKHLIESN